MAKMSKKALSAKMKKVTNKAKEIRRGKPKMKWTTAVKEAWKHYK